MHFSQFLSLAHGSVVPPPTRVRWSVVPSITAQCSEKGEQRNGKNKLKPQGAKKVPLRGHRWLGGPHRAAFHQASCWQGNRLLQPLHGNFKVFILGRLFCSFLISSVLATGAGVCTRSRGNQGCHRCRGCPQLPSVPSKPALMPELL